MPGRPAARISDAVAEFHVWHRRPQGIAEQGIQPGRRQIWRIAAVVSQLRDACRLRRGVRCRGVSPGAPVRAFKRVIMTSYRFAAFLFVTLGSPFPSPTGTSLRQATVTSEPP